MRDYSIISVLSGFAAILMIGVTVGRADTVQLIPDRDGTLYESTAGNVANGTGQFLFVGKVGSRGEFEVRRGLVRFDVASAVPACAEIESATMTMRTSRERGGALTIGLHRVTNDWGEGTSNASGAEGRGTGATANSATWLHRFFNGTPWTNAGGDFDASASATTAVDGLNIFTWSGPGMVQDVEGWLADPLTNFGWLLKGPETQSTVAKRFGSREGTAINSPTLTLMFALPPGDCNQDCSRDLLDFEVLVDCTTGGGSCDCIDFDASGSVDLIDFGRFQTLAGQ